MGETAVTSEENSFFSVPGERSVDRSVAFVWWLGRSVYFGAKSGGISGLTETAGVVGGGIPE